MIYTGLIRIGAAAALTAAGALTAVQPAGAQASGAYRVTDRRCGPFPAARVTALEGACVGIVAQGRPLRFPRTLLEVAPNRFVIVDMGGWARGRGRIFLMTVSRGGQARFRTLFAQLDRPHGIARGPDGKIYIGEAGRIFRFDVDAAPSTSAG